MSKLKTFKIKQNVTAEKYLLRERKKKVLEQFTYIKKLNIVMQDTWRYFHLSNLAAIEI